MAEVSLQKNLRWLRLLRKPLTVLHINYTQFALIVQTKFALAARSQNGIGISLGTRKKESRHPLLFSFLLNLVLGIFISLFMLIPLPLVFKLMTLDTVLFFMFFLTMLTSYSSMILDPKDRLIFTVRGVDSRTLNAARIGVIALFLGLTMLAMAGPSLVVLGMQHSLLVALAALASTLLLAIFALMLALLIYLLTLHFFDGEKLKNVLNVVQIGLIIIMYLASQSVNLLPSHVWVDLAANIPTKLSWWTVIAFPMWFAGLPELASGSVNFLSLLLAALSLAVPLVLLFVYWQHAGRFEDALAKLDHADEQVKKLSGYMQLMKKLFTSGGEEAAYFTLGWRVLASEREFKLRVYPQLAYGMLLPIIFAASFFRGMPFAQSKHYLAYLGLGLILALPTALYNLRFSHQPEAMGIFHYVPFATHGLLLRGILLALLARLVFPFLAVYGVLAIALAGVSAILPVLLSFSLCYTLTMWLGRPLAGQAVPFSEAFTVQKGVQGGNIGCISTTVSIVLVMGIIFAGGFLHTPLFDLPLLLLSLLAGWLWARGYRHNFHYDLTQKFDES